MLNDEVSLGRFHFIIQHSSLSQKGELLWAGAMFPDEFISSSGLPWRAGFDYS